MPWFSLHVHYYDPDVDTLILDAVRPFFASVDAHVAAAYFVRHWRQGPHVRLNLRTDTSTFEETVHPAVLRIVGGFLAARPSRAKPDPSRLLRLHQRLAELEREDGPLLPWRPDNSIHIAPYDRRLHVLGSEVAADLLADFLTATTGTAFEMIDHVRRGGQLLRLAFDLMVAVAHAASGFGIKVGYLSYRSHAEAFLCTWPGARELRKTWDARHREHGPALAQRVRQVVASLDSTTSRVPFVRSWVATLEEYQARARSLIEAGELSVDPPTDGVAAAVAPPLAEVSPFHRALLANERFVREVAPSPWFGAYRVALNYTYLQLTRLGVTPVQRFYLCHLIANTVEELYAVSAMDLVTPSHESVSDPEWSAS